MLNSIPLMMMVVVLAATALRIGAVWRGSGVQAVAVGSAVGQQRFVSVAFALSLVVLAVAAVDAATPDGPTHLGADILGASLAFVGALIAVVAQVQMGQAWRIGVRPDDAPGLIEHGLYRHSRNPIFVGIGLVGLGIAVANGDWWGWVALGTFVLSCDQQIRIEEAHLTSHFGAAYTSFCTRVPRWVGPLGFAP